MQNFSANRNIGVLNAGIGGNHLLTDGLGPNALARFDRDVLARDGVHWLIVFEGVNDLGDLTRNGDVASMEHASLLYCILAAYQQLITRAHARGIRVIGATITPYMGSDYYHHGPASEADRQAINQWIRTSGHFDAVLDFDQIMRDPSHPDHLLPSYDCGDHLHPSPADTALWLMPSLSLSLQIDLPPPCSEMSSLMCRHYRGAFLVVIMNNSHQSVSVPSSLRATGRYAR